MGNLSLLIKVMFKESSSTLTQGLGGSRRRRGSRSAANSKIATVIIVVLLLGVTGFMGYIAHEFIPTSGQSILLALLFGTGFITFFLSIPSVLSSFYASSDIEELLPMPLTVGSIVTAKSVTALAGAYALPTAFLLGPLVGWGIAAGSGAMYWVASIVLVLFAPMLPFAYAGIISVLLASVFKRLRRRDVVTTLATAITIVVTLVVVIGQQFLYRGDTAQVLMGMSSMLDSLAWSFPGYPFAAVAVDAGSAVDLLAFVGISLAAFAVFLVFARLVYLRTVTSITSGSGKAKAYGGEAGKAGSSATGSLAMTEIKKTIRTSPILLNQVIYPVIMLFVVAFISFGGSFSADMGEMTQSGWGNGSLKIIPCVIVLLVVGLLAASTRLSAIAISREGSNWSSLKTIPMPFEKIIRAKMLVGVAVGALMVVAGVLLVLVPFLQHGLGIITLVSAIVIGMAIVWLGSCVSVSADAARPEVDWGNDGDINTRSIRGTAGMIRYMLVAVVFSLLPLVALFGIPADIVMPVVAIVEIVLAFALGRVFVRKAAVNLSSFEG